MNVYHCRVSSRVGGGGGGRRGSFPPQTAQLPPKLTQLPPQDIAIIMKSTLPSPWPYGELPPQDEIPIDETLADMHAWGSCASQAVQVLETFVLINVNSLNQLCKLVVP